MAIAAGMLLALPPAWGQTFALQFSCPSYNQNGVNVTGVNDTNPFRGTIYTSNTNAQEFAESDGANGRSGSGTPNPYGGGSSGPVNVAIGNGVTIAPPGILNAPTQTLGGITTPQAANIWAQSIGGCGNADKHGQGNGGIGGPVTVTAGQGSVIQMGPNVAGILARAAGGQGPGFSDGTTHNWDSGGPAGNVTVTLGGVINEATAATGGSPYANTNNSVGIYALSVGGSSGATDNKDSKLGGNAGTVSVTLTGTGSIAMNGDGSIGIFAMSAGGLSWYADNSDSSGHQNGSGNTSTVTLAPGASITTSGELGVGIVAASTGGNANTNQRPPNSYENDATATNAIPTDLAPAGNAGNVTVTNGGAISTQGAVAIGIAAVSSTGGRAVGLMQDGHIDQVGPGSGSPGTVTVTNSGSINTSGVGAAGILALSLGGPGGVIDTRPGLLNLLGNRTAGNGANGNAVTITNSGSIATQGPVSMGILAESIGGGGGTATGTGGVFAIGTDGGAGGSGATVSVINQGGSVATQGDGSFGILAHSIGGGGGNGGNATGLVGSVGGAGGVSGNGGTVSVNAAPGAGTNWIISTQGDFAPGIALQSIGGGGGNGGYSKAFSLTPIGFAVGGSGGSGGAGGTVNSFMFNVGGTIATSGEQSPGLLAQSIGGGGGSGGAANVYTAGEAFAVSVAVGGNGAKGGNGGVVNVESTATYSTTGVDSIGMILQSIGGGGGHAGSALAKSEAIPVESPPLPTISVSVGVGGSGGAGGSGGTVTLQNDGTIVTQGAGSIGVLAQSIGGGGGNGGDATATAKAIEGQPATVKIGVAVGGGSKAAGDGGAVIVTNGGNGSFDDCPVCVGTVSTSGNNATAILAQSIGGGGGNGGAGNAGVSSPNLGGETGTAIDATYGMGGKGGAGGSGGSVTVANAAGSVIQTAGSGSQGILAQSIGGGGGNAGGGAASGSGDAVVLNVSVGGSGGAGVTGGAVTVTNAGTISTGRLNSGSAGSFTSGGDAVGILAQSIGGGGGTAGSSDAAANISTLFQIEDFLNAPDNSYSGNVAVGGTGGTGGNGNSVQVTNSGSITTLGQRAYGILAQSIGGGGGSGGAATSAAGSVLGGPGGGSKSGTYSATVSVAGSGGVGGNGGNVSVTNSGFIGTAGYGATALVAQSIGGGGGVGAEGSVNTTTTIGLGVGYSGSGSGGGTGGTVTVTSGTLTTVGDDAYGILAQSIGGGGGLGSAGCSNSGAASVQGLVASICFGNTAGATGSLAPWNDASSFTLHVGGGSGASGSGNSVNVDENGAIVTTGARAIGIIAQSIGGGGGIVTAGAPNIANATVQAAPGQNNGAAEPVTVTLEPSGSITTSGAGAWGILAQSISGGGGFAGDPSLPVLFPVSNTLQTNATSQLPGQVRINVAGNITTTGANAHGIVAQSIGGGGGIANNSANNGLLLGNSAQIYSLGAGKFAAQGNGIYITQSAGTIQTSGPGSIGILAQSSGALTSANGGYTQPIFVTISGAVIGGTNVGYNGSGVGAAGVVLSGGGFNNIFSNNPSSYGNFVTVNQGGSISTVDGVAGTAILASDGLTNVTNYGTITGSINLGSSPGAIANNGLLNTGALVVASTLTNAGTVNVGGAGMIGVTTLAGDFVQTADGKLVVDVNSLMGQQADLFNVSGSAQVGGLVVPIATALLPGTFTVLNAGTLSSSAAAQSALVFNWYLGEAANALTITPSANFTP